jgi:CO/xanthine dehydrogenase FAD-binding subunit
MDIRPAELLRAIRLPRSSAALTHYYRKVGTRKAQAISKVCFAGVARMNAEQIADVRIALGSVAPIPIRCVRTESALRGQTLSAETLAAAKAALTTEIAPIDDLRSTRDYRLRVSLNLLEDFVVRLSQLV